MPVVTRQTTARAAKLFALLNCVWLVILALVFAAYWNDYLFHPRLARANLVHLLNGHDPIGGVVPAFVPWAGALGGVTISLLGCVRHSRQWDDRRNLWHALRPVLGAVAASVGFVILVLVLKAAAGTQFETDQIPTNAASQGLFFIIAFLLGFRESLFLELVSKIAKMILTTGEPDQRTAFELNPNAIDFGEVSTTESTATVTIRQTEPESAEKITVSSCSIGKGSDVFSVELLPVDPAIPLSRRAVVTFRPVAAERVTGQLRVIVGGVAGTVELSGSRTGGPDAAAAPAGTEPAVTNGHRPDARPEVVARRQRRRTGRRWHTALRGFSAAAWPAAAGRRPR